MKKNKYIYYKVIQQNYGQGWEDNSFYVCNSMGITTEMSHEVIVHKTGRKSYLSLHAHDLREYKLTGYPTRSVLRKELINS
jgi:hypothetical protein